MPKRRKVSFFNVRNEDVRALKDALENLNTQKSASGKILTGRSNFVSVWSSRIRQLSPNKQIKKT